MNGVPMSGNKEYIYVMTNRRTGVTIQCTQKFMPQWLARGFEVEEIRIVDKSDEC